MNPPAESRGNPGQSAANVLSLGAQLRCARDSGPEAEHPEGSEMGRPPAKA